MLACIGLAPSHVACLTNRPGVECPAVMSLLKTWMPYFKSAVRQRGRAYFQDDHVTLTKPAEGELAQAQVNGESDTYTVTLISEDAAASAQCTCPHFANGSYCKHIWATLIAIQQAPDDLGLEAATLTNPRPPRARKRRPDEKPSRDTEPLWITRLDLIRPPGFEADRTPDAMAPQDHVCYMICAKRSTQQGALVVELRSQSLMPTSMNRTKRLSIDKDSLHKLSDPADRELCALILGATSTQDPDAENDIPLLDRRASLFTLPRQAQRSLLKRMIQTERCFILAHPDSHPVQLLWRGGEPWGLWLAGQLDHDGLSINLELRRDPQQIDIAEPSLVLGGSAGLIIHDHQASLFEDHGAYRWVSQFRESAWSRSDALSIHVPLGDIPRFLDRLYRLPHLPQLDLPDDIGSTPVLMPPLPHIQLESPNAPLGVAQPATSKYCIANIWFAYGPQRVKPTQPGRFVTNNADSADLDDATANLSPDDSPSQPDSDAPPLILRDTQAERDAIAALWPLGFRPDTQAASNSSTLILPIKRLPYAAADLIRQGWVVTTDQQLVRSPDLPTLAVSSGIDWFELRGNFRYHTPEGDQNISIPEILAAARAGKKMITLSDGSQGLMPEQWLADNGLLAAIGQTHDDHLRFKASQAVIIDSLLSQQTFSDVDAKFTELRSRIKQFESAAPVDPAPTFQGELRPYQREGLGWLVYLTQIGLGGILADDMGLGKTIQVLAMLDQRYQQSDDTDPCPPTLIVVPRSIVFNWIDEAQRFAPQLRVQAYTGTDRHAMRDGFTEQHVIVTSYGLMRRDITELRQHTFEFVVLDEAQAIKNPSSQSAKSARLLPAKHRLALSGTPVENHLGDLWSIIEFLNPGMLGSNTRFAKLIRNTATNGSTHGKPGAMASSETHNGNADIATKAQKTMQVAKALRPFILRRTKQQVLKDLPEKTEQTIVCQMEPSQRKVYDQLLTHYRGALLGKQAAPGQSRQSTGAFGGSSMMVLEALLRLRQAACHPGLIDIKRSDEPSAKLDVLLDRVHDLIEEGHKALIFSQFTSMLALVRKQLDAQGIVYEYLDGQTRNRQQPVERFQNDPSCPLFLISLKAGGLGLNLTAAEYVFILDPWWNPAVEAQAIDRAHRIGQTQHVFAYRLICEDTVEQRIAELQTRKRALADAIIGEQENPLKNLTRDDLKYLLA